MFAVPIVGNSAISMNLLHFLKSQTDFFKIVTRDACQFTTIDKHQKLRFDTSIEESFYSGMLVAVYADVMVGGVLVAEVLIILFNLGALRVPLGCEVEQSERRSLLVKMVYDVEHAFLLGSLRHVISFAWS